MITKFNTFCFLQFFIGWWIMIDAAAIETFEPAYHSIGVVSSLAVVM